MRFLLATAVCFTALPTLPCESSIGGELPLKRECIVGAHLDWNDSLSIPDRRELIDRLTDIVYFRASNLIAGIQMQNLHSIYAIYRENCADKDGNFEKLLVAASEELGNKFKIRIVSERIEPGAKTINMSGPWWRDGESTSNQG